MNLLDYLIIIFIIISVLYGAAKGLVYSIFKVVGLIGSIIITKMYYGHVASFLMGGTDIVAGVNSFITKKGADSGNININLIEKFDISIPTTIISDGLSSYFSILIINGIALFITFIIVKICMTLLQVLLKEVFKLPVLNFINFSGGAILGFAEALLILLLVFALVTPISVLNKSDYISSLLEESTLVEYFYSYNFILKWMFDSALSVITH